MSIHHEIRPRRHRPKERTGHRSKVEIGAAAARGSARARIVSPISWKKWYLRRCCNVKARHTDSDPNLPATDNHHHLVSPIELHLFFVWPTRSAILRCCWNSPEWVTLPTWKKCLEIEHGLMLMPFDAAPLSIVLAKLGPSNFRTQASYRARAESGPSLFRINPEIRCP